MSASSNLENLNVNKLNANEIKSKTISSLQEQINSLNLENTTGPINTLNTEPISNAQSGESSLANATLDAVKDLTDCDVVMVKSSHFLGKNSRNLDVDSAIKNCELYHVEVPLSLVKETLEHAFSHDSHETVQVSGVQLDFNVQANKLWRLYVGEYIAWSIIDFYGENAANNTSDNPSSLLLDPKHKTTEAGYGGPKYSEDSLLSVVVDEHLMHDMHSHGHKLDFDLKDSLQTALNSLRVSKNTKSIMSELSVSNINVPVLLSKRINLGGYGVGLRYLCASGKPFTNETGKLIYEEGTNGASATPSIGNIVATNVMRNGGNAADAIVAAAFMINTDFNQAGYLGGGGFITIYDKNLNKSFAIDCREALSMRIPKQENEDGTLLDWPCPREVNGVSNPNRAFSQMSNGVAGFFAGLELLHRNHGSGKFTLAELLQPAVDVLEQNRKVTTMTLIGTLGSGGLIQDNLGSNFDQHGIIDVSGHVERNYVSKDSDGKYYMNATKNKMTLHNGDMLELYRNIQRHGLKFMYKSQEHANTNVPTFADKYCQAIQNQLKADPLGDAELVKDFVPVVSDFEMYEAKYRTPAVTKFNHNGDSYEIHTHPAPCASHCGGFGVKLAIASNALINNDPMHPGTMYRVAMIQVLCKDMRGYVAGDYDNWANTNVLANFQKNIEESYGWTPDLTGITTNAQFNEYLVSDLVINKFTTYLESLSEWNNAANLNSVDLDSSDYVSPEQLIEGEEGATNNFCAADDNMWIQFNNSINFLKGCRASVDEIWMNNEVYDFPDIGTYGTNYFGPGRRPASSQAPNIVLKNGEPFYTVGGSGGWRIYIGCMWRMYLAVLGYSAEIIENNLPGPVSSFGFCMLERRVPQKIATEMNKVLENTEYFRNTSVNYNSTCVSLSIMEKHGVYTAVPSATLEFGNSSVVNKLSEHPH